MKITKPQQEVKRLRALARELLHALQDARDMIALEYGEENWPKIRGTKKMKRINAVIAKAGKTLNAP